MDQLARFLKRNSKGVTASLFMIGSTIAEDLNLPEIISPVFFFLGAIFLLLHFVVLARLRASKGITFGEFLANGFGPVMLVWVIAALLRAGVLGFLGKPL